MIAHFSIGNTDDKLSQKEWANFCGEAAAIADYYVLHGVWFSLPTSQYQNACWCLELDAASKVGQMGQKEQLEESLRALAIVYHQDSIAVAYSPETVFVGAEGGRHG